MSKKQYNQSGGFPGALVAVGNFVVGLVMKIFEALKDLLIQCFDFRPKKGEDGPEGFIDYFNLKKKWNIGHFWVYIWWCIKVIIYLILFCFGGPIIMLAGIVYLYSQLGAKLSLRNDASDNADNAKNNSKKSNSNE